MSVRELEQAISQLSKDDLAQLGRWFDEYRADEWDRQIEPIFGRASWTKPPAGLISKRGDAP